MNVIIEQSCLLENWPIISDVGKVIGVIIAALWTLGKYQEQKQKDRAQQQKDWEQQRDQMRRDQCSRGLAMINELLKSNDSDKEYYSWDAMKMLDYKDETRTITNMGLDTSGRVVQGFQTKLTGASKVDEKVIKEALSVTEIGDVPKQGEARLLLYVRECFDELYFRMGQLEDAIGAGLVTFDDVKTPIDYYVGLMAKDIAIHFGYLNIEEHDYNKTLRYLGRFESWKEAVEKLPVHPPSH
jgi:hypothetical protein